MLVYLLMWVGLLYANTLSLITGWPPVFIAAYHAVRVVALLGVIVFLWWIVFRTSTAVERKVCAVGFAFCVLLGVLTF
jgi:membrane protein insertase Oxa1/YidC/SpoIIIJ